MRIGLTPRSTTFQDETPPVWISDVCKHFSRCLAVLRGSMCRFWTTIAGPLAFYVSHGGYKVFSKAEADRLAVRGLPRHWGYASKLSGKILFTTLSYFLLFGPPALGRSLERGVPGLFGGGVRRSATDLSSSGFTSVSRSPFPKGLQQLGKALSAARSQAPIPSAGASFRYIWDEELEIHSRVLQSLGPIAAERAQTLGRGALLVNVSYNRIDFDSFNGQDLDRATFQQPAFSLQEQEEIGLDIIRNDVLQTDLDLDLSLNMVFLSAAYGVTNNLDLGFALSLNEASLDVAATTLMLSGGDGGGFFTRTGNESSFANGETLQDSYDESSFGTGDVYLRAKWNFLDFDWADFATAGILTIPTGNADDFLGFHDVTFTGWLIASKTFLHRFSPHLNIGYALRSGKDVSQALWVAGVDVIVTDWLTVGTDFLGFHDDNRDGVNDDVLQNAIGFRLNPFRNWVLATTVQFPLNDDGLRSDATCSVQLETQFR